MAIKKLPVIGVIPDEAVELTKFQGTDCVLIHVDVPLSDDDPGPGYFGWLLIPLMHPLAEEFAEDLRRRIFGEEEEIDGGQTTTD
ncbi:MAG: hypothetical protein PHR07_08020 [Acidaminococcaceae bacterium]|jgi:hypothetical protein|nr:hypothetical protein [Acidaminococcaceae bacterium]